MKIEDKFDLCVVELCKTEPDEVKPFILHHERKPVVIENLKREIRMYELQFPARLKKDHEKNKRHVNEMIAVASQIFVKAAKLEREQKNMSHAERVRIENADYQKKQALECIREVEPVEGQQPHEKLIFDSTAGLGAKNGRS